MNRLGRTDPNLPVHGGQEYCATDDHPADGGWRFIVNQQCHSRLTRPGGSSQRLEAGRTVRALSLRSSTTGPNLIFRPAGPRGLEHMQRGGATSSKPVFDTS